MSFSDAPSYGGTSQSRAVNNNKFPSEGPRAMEIRVDFTAANQSVVIDLTIEQQQKQISQVQGLWINNSDGPNLVLVCEVTNQVVNIAAGVQGYVQLLSQNPPRFRLSSDAIASVTLHFLNFPVIHSINAKPNPPPVPGVLEVVAGTNVTVDNTDPQRPIVNATGGGGGKVQYTQVAKFGAGQSITGVDINAAAFTPFFVATGASLDLDFSTLNGTYLILFQSYASGGSTLNSLGGSWIIDRSGSAVGSITCAQFEVVQMLAVGDGAGNSTAQVISRY